MTIKQAELGYFGNIWVRQNLLENVGDETTGHLHYFDHVSLLSNGKVEVEIEGYPPKEFTAPTFIVIRKEHKHKRKWNKKQWDNDIPPDNIFKEIFRVSKNQVIFGGNYFTDILPISSCWVVWDKVNGMNDFADCELAWTSFKTAVRQITFQWHGMLQQDMKNKETRIHPTQKPLELFEKLLINHNHTKN